MLMSLSQRGNYSPDERRSPNRRRDHDRNRDRKRGSSNEERRKSASGEPREHRGSRSSPGGSTPHDDDDSLQGNRHNSPREHRHSDGALQHHHGRHRSLDRNHRSSGQRTRECRQHRSNRKSSNLKNDRESHVHEARPSATWSGHGSIGSGKTYHHRVRDSSSPYFSTLAGGSEIGVGGSGGRGGSTGGGGEPKKSLTSGASNGFDRVRRFSQAIIHGFREYN